MVHQCWRPALIFFWFSILAFVFQVFAAFEYPASSGWGKKKLKLTTLPRRCLFPPLKHQSLFGFGVLSSLFARALTQNVMPTPNTQNKVAPTPAPNIDAIPNANTTLTPMPTQPSKRHTRHKLRDAAHANLYPFKL